MSNGGCVPPDFPASFSVRKAGISVQHPSLGLRRYFTRPLLTILCLGFASGLPLALTASTLSAWLSEAKVDKTTIGLFAAVATPYTLKFLWSPLMDSLRFPVLTRRLG